MVLPPQESLSDWLKFLPELPRRITAWPQRPPSQYLKCMPNNSNFFFFLRDFIFKKTLFEKLQY